MATTDACLADAGCTDELAQRFHELEERGDVEACLRLLRCHRCQLVQAMHEAQRPIDVCDWLIRDLKTRSVA